MRDEGTKLPDSGRRYPIQQVDWNFVRTVLAGDTIISKKLLEGGACNTSYHLEMDSGEHLVYRLYSRGCPQKEFQAMSFVEKQLPVPQILEMGDQWAIMKFIPGNPLAPGSSALQDVGRCLGILSSTKFDKMGELEEDGSISPLPFDGFLGFFEQELSRKKTLEWLPECLQSHLRQFINDHASIYRKLDSQKSLVHGDFNPGNILTRDECVVGILDWEFAMSGSTMIDTGNLLRHCGEEASHALARGMSNTGISLERDWVKQSRLADLASHIEFLSSDHTKRFKERCVERIRALVQPGF